MHRAQTSIAVLPSGIISHRPWVAASPNSRLADDTIPLRHFRNVESALLDSAPPWGA